MMGVCMKGGLESCCIGCWYRWGIALIHRKGETGEEQVFSIGAAGYIQIIAFEAQSSMGD
jgi:hypothetical protein